MEAVQFRVEVVREATEHRRDAGVRDLLGRVVEARHGATGDLDVGGDLGLGQDAGLLGFQGRDPLFRGATDVLPLGGSFGRRGRVLRVFHDAFLSGQVQVRLMLRGATCSPHRFDSILPLLASASKGIHQDFRRPFHVETASERIDATDHPITGRGRARRVQPTIGRGHHEGHGVEPIVRGLAVRADVGTVESRQDSLATVLRPRGRLFRGIDFEESIRQGRGFRQGQGKIVPELDPIGEATNLFLGVLPRLDGTLDAFLHDFRLVLFPCDTVRNREIVSAREKGGKHVLAPGAVRNEFPLGLASVVRIDENHVVNKFLTGRKFDPARVQAEDQDFHGLAAIRQETARENGIRGRPSLVAERLHLRRDVHQGHGGVGLGNVLRPDDHAVTAPEEQVLIRDRGVSLGVNRLDSADAVVTARRLEELGEALVEPIRHRSLDRHADAFRVRGQVEEGPCLLLFPSLSHGLLSVGG